MKNTTKKSIEELLKAYPTKRAALLPALWEVQAECGWVPPEDVQDIASLLEITPAEVTEVASFYTMFSRKPLGKHHIQVCVGVCCKLCGAERILDHLRKKLDIDIGESTEDGVFHLSTVECLGSCGTAPMMQVDDEYHEDLTEKSVDDILSSFKK